MLRQASQELRLPTRGRGLYEFTDEVAAWIAQNGWKSGLLTPRNAFTSGNITARRTPEPSPSTSLENRFMD
jgi:thiamine phosphate synthase YjbQ (UPF0047 family)